MVEKRGQVKSDQEPSSPLPELKLYLSSGSGENLSRDSIQVLRAIPLAVTLVCTQFQSLFSGEQRRHLLFYGPRTDNKYFNYVHTRVKPIANLPYLGDTDREATLAQSPRLSPPAFLSGGSLKELGAFVDESGAQEARNWRHGQSMNMSTPNTFVRSSSTPTSARS